MGLGCTTHGGGRKRIQNFSWKTTNMRGPRAEFWIHRNNNHFWTDLCVTLQTIQHYNYFKDLYEYLIHSILRTRYIALNSYSLCVCARAQVRFRSYSQLWALATSAEFSARFSNFSRHLIEASYNGRPLSLFTSVIYHTSSLRF